MSRNRLQKKCFIVSLGMHLLLLMVVVFGVAPDTDGDGLLKVKSNTGQDLIHAGASNDGSGFFFGGYNKTGQNVVLLYADKSGNGVVDTYIADKILYNSEGKGRTLKPGP